MAHRVAADARGAGQRRNRKARPAGGSGWRVLGRRLLDTLPDSQEPARCGGARSADPGEDAGAHSSFLHIHPGALERHYSAVELLSGEGPRPARIRAGRLAAALYRETRRDAAALVVDG